AQIRVNLVRADRVPVAVIVEILEQLVAREIATTFADARKPANVDVALVAIAALAAEAEMNTIAVDADMAIAQRGHPKAFVFPSVFTVADGEQRQFHHAHDSGQHAF